MVTISMNYLQLLFFVCAFVLTVRCSTAKDADSSLVGSEACSIGPSYWCQNFTTATECNAVRHCIQTVWNMRNEAVSLVDSECSTCVDKIAKLKEGVNSTTTKEVVEEVLDYVCEVTIITSILRKQCEEMIHKYVDDHINELLDLLSSNVDPQTICKLFGFCAVGSPVSVQPSEILDANEVLVQFDNVALHFPSQHPLFLLNDLPQLNLDATKIISDISNQDLWLVGDKKCTWGPSYWCGSLTNSKECRSTSHCIGSVWSTLNFPEDDDNVCNICKDMIKETRDLFLSNKTQVVLVQVFERSCKLIHLKDVSQECKKLADEFIQEMTEMLASKIDPIGVCSVAGLCNSPRIDNLLANSANSQLSGVSEYDTCTICTTAFTFYRNFMDTASKTDVIQRILSVCSELSSYSDLCSSLVQRNSDNLYQTLRQIDTFSGCHLSAMCSFNFHSHREPYDVEFHSNVDSLVSSNDPDLPCDLCKQLVLHFKQVLIANTTEEEFHQVLLGMCEQTGKFRAECIELVNDNFRVIYEFLTEELDPENICEAIQICPKPKSLSSDLKVNRGPYRIADALAGDVLVTAVAPSTVANVECEICLKVVEESEELMKDTNFDNDLETVLHEVCTFLPNAEEKSCQDFIHTYIDTLLNLLKSNTDPKVVCSLMKTCVNLAAATSKDPLELCPVCKFVLGHLRNALDNPKNEDEIRKELLKVCSIAPQTARDECDRFVNSYSTTIVTIIEMEIDPELACPAMKLCPAPASQPKKCDHCQHFMNKLISSLSGNLQADEIKSQIMKIASSVSSDSHFENSTVPVQLILLHREAIIDMVLAEFDPNESCVYLQFCSVAEIDKTKAVSATAEISAGVIGKPSCEICELVIRVYEHELTSNKTEEEVKDELEKFCRRMRRDDLRADCIKLVDEYLPQIFDLIKKGVNPKEVCTSMKLCSLAQFRSSNSCTECELVVGAVESQLSDPRNAQTISSEIMQICSKMSGKTREICSIFVEEVVPQVEGLVFSVPPWFVCSKLRACPYMEFFDDSVCADPDMWCKSMKNAFQCDKLQFCKNTLWKTSKPPSQ